jgi:hypothetical protein
VQQVERSQVEVRVLYPLHSSAHTTNVLTGFILQSRLWHINWSLNRMSTAQIRGGGLGNAAGKGCWLIGSGSLALAAL